MDFPLAEPEERINLAHVAPFRLGAIEVHPAIRQVVRGGVRESVEPRVMQVLVALARAEGGVVTRDELIDCCWAGRIVGENAIHRVISRLREIGTTVGRGSFRIETIAKVGYRIVANGDCPPDDKPPAETKHARAMPDRRAVLGGAAAALGALGAYGWLSEPRHRPLPQAQELYNRGVIAQRHGSFEQCKQAIFYFEEAVEIDPLYAEAWGALALSYRYILEGGMEAYPASLLQKIASASRRALALDPDNADGHVAVAITRPCYRNWVDFEKRARAMLARFPDHWMLRSQYGHLLYQVGRWEDGIDQARKLIEIDPYLPSAYANLGRGLWAAGRIQEAESILEEGLRRWSAHWMLWSARFSQLLFGGRPAEAAAFVLNRDTEPFGMAPNAVANRVLAARAIADRKPADIAAATAVYETMAKNETASVWLALPILAVLGATDTVFAISRQYYLDRTAFDAHARRYTDMLFTPPFSGIRRDPRFERLLADTGLEAYWRVTGTTPDFRRG